MKRNRLHNKQVDIGGILYTFKYRKAKRVKGKQDLTVRGEIDFDKRVIEIEKGLAPSEETSVIIHEIMHGVLDAFIPAHILDAGDKVEELIVGPAARILAGALRSAKLLNEN
jgi:hypothetical protein